MRSKPAAATRIVLLALAPLALSGCGLDQFAESDAGLSAEVGVGEGPALPSPPAEGEGPGAPRADDPMCQGVDEEGSCRGTTVIWCEAGVVRTIDCAAIGNVCGWDDGSARYFCVEDGPEPLPPPQENPDDAPAPPPNDPPEDPPAAPPAAPDPNDPCGGLDYLGVCEGTIARWCDDGELKEVDCAWWGQPCGWVDGDSGYYCGGSGERPGGDPPPNDPPPNSPPPNNPPSDPSPPPAPPPEPPVGDACGNDEERAVVMLTNQARAMFGQAALACAEVNTRTARLHSEDMCNRGYFSHTGRDGSQPWDRLRRQGGSFGTAGENIAWGYDSPQSVHEGWMNSPGHRQNILSGSYRRIGVGLAPCNGRKHWTQVFSD